MRQLLLQTLSLSLLLSLSFSQAQTKVNFASDFVNNWACKLGKLQSPIGILTNQSDFTSLLHIVNDEYTPYSNGVLYYNSLTGEVEFKEVNDILNGNSTSHGSLIISIFQYYMKFDLEKIVIKSPGEHSIDGVFPDMEIQFIHQKDLDYKNDLNKYKKKPTVNEKLKVTLPFNQASSFNGNGFLDILSSVYKTTVSNSTTGIRLDLTSFNLVADKKFFFYYGSETVNPCNENTIHIVYSSALPLKTASYGFYRSSIYSQIYNQAENTKVVITSYYERMLYRNYLVKDSEFDGVRKEISELEDKVFAKAEEIHNGKTEGVSAYDLNKKAVEQAKKDAESNTKDLVSEMEKNEAAKNAN